MQLLHPDIRSAFVVVVPEECTRTLRTLVATFHILPATSHALPAPYAPLCTRLLIYSCLRKGSHRSPLCYIPLQGSLTVDWEHGATLRSSWSIDDSQVLGKLACGASLDYDAVSFSLWGLEAHVRPLLFACDPEIRDIVRLHVLDFLQRNAVLQLLPSAYQHFSYVE